MFFYYTRLRITITLPFVLCKTFTKHEQKGRMWKLGDKTFDVKISTP